MTLNIQDRQHIAATPGSVKPAVEQRPKPVLNGRGLKHRCLSTHQRAKLAAGWMSGAIDFQPSLEQAALVFEVPRSLLSALVRARNGNSNGHHRKPTRVDRLKADLKSATAAELAAVGAGVGVGLIWDRLISPVLDGEKSAASAASK
jgi:hypothetical protein